MQPTNLTSSIQVSEEALRVGAQMLCHNHSMLAGDEDAWRLHVDEARSIYLAMRSKDHSIAVDDVQLVVGAIAANLDISDDLLIELQCVGNLEATARAIITAIGSQSK